MDQMIYQSKPRQQPSMKLKLPTSTETENVPPMQNFSQHAYTHDEEIHVNRSTSISSMNKASKDVTMYDHMLS